MVFFHLMLAAATGAVVVGSSSSGGGGGGGGRSEYDAGSAAGIGIRRPNFVVFLADDLGIGDVGCFGNGTARTPNIDRLCREGARLTHLVADAAVCTPSRAAFLTGRHAVRTGMAGGPGGPLVVMYTAGRAGIPEGEVTWAELLRREGYDTAAIGKWHLGWDGLWRGDQAHGPLTHGFRHFYGLPFTLVDGFEMRDPPFLTYSGFAESDHPLHRHAVAAALSLLVVCAVYSKNFGYSVLVAVVVVYLVAWFFLEHFRLHRTEGWWKRSFFMEKFLNSLLMEDRKVAEQPIKLGTLGERLLEKATQFLDGRNASSSSEPFALYYSFPNVHVPLVPGRQFRGKSNHGAYGDSLMEMDHAVGQILDLLDAQGLADDTFVLFASDHGCHIDRGTEGGSNGPFSGGKGIGASEGGLRVPGLIRWPSGGVKPGSEVAAVASLMDLMPTMADILGTETGDKKLDGKSLLPLLQGRTQRSPHRFIRHYCGTTLHAVRVVREDGRVFKGYFRRPVLNPEGHCGYDSVCPCHPGGGEVEELPRPVVYDIGTDPGERRPLKEDSELYLDLEPLLWSEFRLAESESPSLPPSQFVDAFRLMPSFWLQPCARFPLCRTYN